MWPMATPSRSYKLYSLLAPSISTNNVHGGIGTVHNGSTNTAILTRDLSNIDNLQITKLRRLSAFMGVHRGEMVLKRKITLKQEYISEIQNMGI